LTEKKYDSCILVKLILLSNLYYLYDYANQLLDFMILENILPQDEIESISQSQSDLRLLQAHYLSQGGLSLWHRDSA
jgi:hypothetical protein